MIADLFAYLSDFLVPIAIVGGAFAAGIGAAFLLVAVINGIARRQTVLEDRAIRSRLRLPSLVLVPSLFLAVAIPLSGLPEATRQGLVHAVRVVIVLAASWTSIRGLAIGEDVLLSRYRLDVSDNLKARKVHTQIRYIRRIASAVIVIIAVGAALLTFDEIRQLGTTLLTTAGVAGVIVGFAAQKTLSTIIAGLQIAFTQPIRVEDAVIVEGEWGWIEEITLTYVVVKLWDWRRLVVPINYFLDNVFQNWTRSTSRMIGTVFLHLDYRFPVDALREELGRILDATELWDGGVQVVQVTDAGEHSMEVRVLVSATTSPRLWDLRCLVRERLVAFAQESYPEMLPRFRAELSGGAGDPS